MVRQIQEELHLLNKQIKDLNGKLLKSPEGSISCARNGRNVKWYYTDGSAGYIYLPKSQKAKAEKLALKRFHQVTLSAAQKKKEALENCISVYEQQDKTTTSMLEETSPYHELILPYYEKLPSKVSAWAAAEYETNPEYLEHKKFHTKKGDLVRSKSEVFIADELFMHKIPYHYEEKLDLKAYGIYYPDFTICHPRSEKIIFWEHFGLMDNEEYIHKAYRKLDVYTMNGIVPTMNLIVTFETRENPLDPGMIEKVISDYFL